VEQSGVASDGSVRFITDIFLLYLMADKKRVGRKQSLRTISSKVVRKISKKKKVRLRVSTKRKIRTSKKARRPISRDGYISFDTLLARLKYSKQTVFDVTNKKVAPKRRQLADYIPLKNLLGKLTMRRSNNK